MTEMGQIGQITNLFPDYKEIKEEWSEKLLTITNHIGDKKIL